MKFIFFILFLPALIVHAQMLENPRGEILEERPFFNPEFIKKHKIRSFRGNYSTKFNFDIIRPNNDVFVYQFDRLGQLVRKYKILKGDTLATSYQYDYKGNITLRRETNKFGFYEYRFWYDDRDRMTKMEIRREQEVDYNKFSFELDESTIIAVEKYEYISLGQLNYKRICYNKSGRIYKNEYYYFNEDGYLAKRETALHNGNNRVEENYFYDQKNRVTEVKTIFVSAGGRSERKIFEYDEMGNIISRKVYSGENIAQEDQLVYREKDNSLKAIISREAGESMLTILEFKLYRFY